jgi:hypothetical protein
MLANRGRFTTLAFLLVLVMATVASPQTASSSYPNVPDVLSQDVNEAVNNIVQHGEAARLEQSIVRLVTSTVVDAASETTSEEIRKMKPYEYYAAVRRTDQQVGASSTSSGSTSAVEKPGLIELISFAVERGAIQQSIDDSTVTLTTSPYALVAAVKGDSPQNYQNNPWLTHLGVSATFILNDPKNPSSSLSRKQLTQWSAKVLLSGDRSTRSKAFRQFWETTVGRAEQDRLDALTRLQTRIVNNRSIENLIVVNRADNFVARLEAEIAKYLTDNQIAPRPVANLRDPNTVPAAQRQAIREMILHALFAKIHEPVRTGTISVDAPALGVELRRLAELQAIVAQAQATFRSKIDEWAKKGTVSTFAYTNHRVAEGSDYSEFKLLFDRHVNGLDAVLNANFSIYNKPDTAKNQQRLRDFSISGSLEWASKSNPFFRGDEEVATPITLSFNGRYERLKENENMPTMREPNIGNFQARLEIPVAAGFSIPIAYTYATATEMMPKPENKFNVGLHIDVDKILNFKKATKAQ